MKNGNGNIVTRTVDGRSAPIHVVTVKNIEKTVLHSYIHITNYVILN